MKFDIMRSPVEARFRVELEERQKEIEREEKKLNEDEAKFIERKLSDEEKQKLKESKEAMRRKWVFEFYKELAGKDMLEEDYKEYIAILEDDNTREDYSILSYINKEYPIYKEDNETNI